MWLQTDKEIGSLNIVIVGGGLGGFAVGISLLQCGFRNVTVYEKDQNMSIRRQGYGLTILQGISALKHLGVFEQVKQQDTPSRSHFIFRKDGNLLGFFGTGLWEERCIQSKKYNLHIQRQELRRILMERYIALHPLGSKGIKWNQRLVHIDTEDCSVAFLNQPDIYNVDLVIGADGINSVTRMFKFDPLLDSKLSYLGILVVLGITGSINHFLGQDRVFQTLDGHFRLFAMPFSKTTPSQSIMWQMSFPLDISQAKYFASNPIQLKEFLMEHCKCWHDPIPQMIDSTPIDLIMGIPAFDRDLDVEPVSMENNSLPIILIGDASHPMSPFKGQGANQVLLDAVELVDCIENFFKQVKDKTLKNRNACKKATNEGINAKVLSSKSILFSAVREFECRMMTRVKVKVQQSRERVFTFHMESVLMEENFFYRGIDSLILRKVHSLGISSNWNNSTETIEEALRRVLQESQNDC